MKQRILVIILAILATTEVCADPPARKVDSGQQATRDHEKLQILLKELDEQRGLAAGLNQKKALALEKDNKPELADTEIRLVEVNDNITQLQQEINLAQGQPTEIQPVVIQPAALRRNQGAKTDNGIPTQTELEKATENTGQWWDFYRRKN
jgi:hypothetical protein